MTLNDANFWRRSRSPANFGVMMCSFPRNGDVKHICANESQQKTPDHYVVRISTLRCFTMQATNKASSDEARIVLTHDPGSLEKIKTASERCKCNVVVVSNDHQMHDVDQNQKADIVLLVTEPEHVLQDATLRLLRSHDTAPVLVYLTEYEEVAELLALRVGANDVLNSQMTFRVMRERIMAAHRTQKMTDSVSSKKDSARARPIENRASKHTDILFDQSAGVFTVNDKQVFLSLVEAKLLAELYKHRSSIVGRRELLVAIGKGNSGVKDRLIDSHVKRLRKKFSDAGIDPAILSTVYGQGYRLKAFPPA